MTTISLEASTIADTVAKAAKVAPSKAGQAFDQAAGIVFDIYPGEDVELVVRATNQEIFYSEATGVLSASGPSVRWRMSSRLLDHTMRAIGTTSSRAVNFTQQGGRIVVKSGRLTAQMPLIDPEYYPTWESFDADDLSTVTNLGSRLARVEWAAAKSAQPPLSGIYLDGQYITATDRYRVARVECKIDLDEPVLIPPGISGVLRAMGETSIGVEGTNLLLAPDNWTQIRTTVFDTPYPDIDALMSRNSPGNYTDMCEVNKELFAAKVNAAVPFSGAERSPIVKTIWGRGELAVFLDQQQDGLFGDVIEIPGQADHPRTTIPFQPANLTPALQNAPGDKVKIYYSHSEPLRPMLIDGGSGYTALVMPIKELAPSAE